MYVTNSFVASVQFDWTEKEKMQMYSNAIVRMIQETGIQCNLQWNRQETMHWIYDLQLYAGDNNYDKLQPLVNDIYFLIHGKQMPVTVPVKQHTRENIGYIKGKEPIPDNGETPPF